MFASIRSFSVRWSVGLSIAVLAACSESRQVTVQPMDEEKVLLQSTFFPGETNPQADHMRRLSGDTGVIAPPTGGSSTPETGVIPAPGSNPPSTPGSSTPSTGPVAGGSAGTTPPATSPTGSNPTGGTSTGSTSGNTTTGSTGGASTTPSTPSTNPPSTNPDGGSVAGGSTNPPSSSTPPTDGGSVAPPTSVPNPTDSGTVAGNGSQSGSSNGNSNTNPAPGTGTEVVPPTAGSGTGSGGTSETQPSTEPSNNGGVASSGGTGSTPDGGSVGTGSTGGTQTSNGDGGSVSPGGNPSQPSDSGSVGSNPTSPGGSSSGGTTGGTSTDPGNSNPGSGSDGGGTVIGSNPGPTTGDGGSLPSTGGGTGSPSTGDGGTTLPGNGGGTTNPDGGTAGGTSGGGTTVGGNTPPGGTTGGTTGGTNPGTPSGGTNGGNTPGGSTGDGGAVAGNPGGTGGTSDGGSTGGGLPIPPADGCETGLCKEMDVEVHRVCSERRSAIPYPYFIFFEEAKRPILAFETQVDSKRRACVADTNQNRRGRTLWASIGLSELAQGATRFENAWLNVIFSSIDLRTVNLLKSTYETEVRLAVDQAKMAFPRWWRDLYIQVQICDDKSRDGSCLDESGASLLNVYQTGFSLSHVPNKLNLYVWSGRSKTLRNSPSACELQYSPLVLDIAANGISLRGPEDGVWFDLNATGEAVMTGWMRGKDDALLVRDRNHDDNITDGGELFGSATTLARGKRAENGFAALSEMDSDADGLITPKDADWSELKLWFDRNVDGESQSDELYGLDDFNVVSIRLDYVEMVEVDPYGNETRQRSVFYRKNRGKPRPQQIVDVWFNTLNAY